MLLGLVLWPAHLAAANDDPIVAGQRLSALVGSARYNSELRTYLTGYETWIGPCPDPTVESRIQTLVLQKTIPFPGVPTPQEPQWIDIVQIGGCARPYERPVYATVHEGKTVFYAHLLGSTRTEPNLQHATVHELIAAEKAAAIASGCPQTQPVRVLTTAFVSQTETEYGKAWRETWTLANCRGAKQVTIDFRPDHTGGIKAKLNGYAD